MILKQYIADIELPEVLTEDFLRLIPEQRKLIDELLSNGTLYFYSLAFDRSRLWVGIRAGSEAEVWNILYTFPLIEYLNADIYELAFHNIEKAGVFELSLN